MAEDLYADFEIGEEKNDDNSRKDDSHNEDVGLYDETYSPQYQHHSSENEGDDMNSEHRSESPESQNGCVLAIRHLQWWTTDQQIEDLMSQFGKVKAIKFFEDKINGKSKGYCLVEFFTRSAAENAKNGAPEELDGRQIAVNFASEDSIQYLNRMPGNSSEIKKTIFQNTNNNPMNFNPMFPNPTPMPNQNLQNMPRGGFVPNQNFRGGNPNHRGNPNQARGNRGNFRGNPNRGAYFRGNANRGFYPNPQAPPIALPNTNVSPKPASDYQENTSNHPSSHRERQMSPDRDSRRSRDHSPHTSPDRRHKHSDSGSSRRKDDRDDRRDHDYRRRDDRGSDRSRRRDDYRK